MTKSYVSGDFAYLTKLFYASSRYSFFMLWFLCLPIMLCIDTILKIWLKQVPENAGVFVNLILAYSLINVLNNPIWSVILAVGKLKKYICIGSGVFLLSFPLSYIFLKKGCDAAFVLVINDVVRAIYILVVLNIIKKYIPITFLHYVKNVFIPIFAVIGASGIFSLFLRTYTTNTLLDEFILGGSAVIVNSLCILFMGLNKVERKVLLTTVQKRIFMHA